MLRTPICDLLGIEHPVALGGMGSATSPELVAAVSNAGGLGALGCHGQTPEQVGERTASIRRQTNKPFGLNFLLFHTRDDSFAAALELRPPVMQFAWAKPEQDLRDYVERSHKVGCLVTYMAGTVPEAQRAVQAGADIIIAQGTEGGGHVGWMASMPLLPTIVDSDGHDTQLSEIPDIASGLVWPGAMIRSRRNRFIERWAGREWDLRRDRAEAWDKLNLARRTGDVDEGPLSMGQDAGLIHDIPPAGEIVTRIVREAEEILGRLPRLIGKD